MARPLGPEKLKLYAQELTRYLASKAWKIVQHNVRLRAKNKCECCGAVGGIRIWLKEPESIGTDDAEDAIALCVTKCFPAYVNASKAERYAILNPPTKPKRRYTRRAGVASQSESRLVS